MEKKIIRTVSTKVTADHDAVSTNLTIDFSNVTEADVYEIAAQAATIKWQSNVRRAGTIPATATYMVVKPGTHASGVVSKEAAIRRLLGEKADFFLTKYGVEEAWERTKKVLGDLALDAETEE